ncbi:hypothetical protein BRC75_00905 [Halobacteriales archaeon QH_7_69_31]|nr:MAG: hypothetical protein BRC75_00905 [Halobacteriales archaeon QH_7_69_31]
MNPKQIAALALSALLLTAGLGAVAAQPPADAQNNQTYDEDRGEEYAANASANGSGSANASANASDRGNGSATAEDAREGQGPPTDVSEHVPDHVVEIHVLVNQFLDGELETALGPAIVDVTPDDGNETDDGVDENEDAEHDEDEDAEDDDAETEDDEKEDAEDEEQKDDESDGDDEEEDTEGEETEDEDESGDDADD